MFNNFHKNITLKVFLNWKTFKDDFALLRLTSSKIKSKEECLLYMIFRSLGRCLKFMVCRKKNHPAVHIFRLKKYVMTVLKFIIF